MAVGIFAITLERKELETCGFHHSRENSVGHKSMLNLISPAVDQSGEFLKNISTNEISQTFSYLIFSF
jgi:hypothetical protein